MFQSFVSSALKGAVYGTAGLSMLYLAYASEGTQSPIDHIYQGINRAKVTPIETRPLTPAEVFAYRP